MTNWILPFGGIARGILSGIELSEQLEELQRQRKERELAGAFDLLSRVVGSKEVQPEVVDYVTKLVTPVFEKHKLPLPPFPQIQPPHIRELEQMMDRLRRLRELRQSGQLDPTEYHYMLFGRPPEVEKDDYVVVDADGVPVRVKADVWYREMMRQKTAGMRGGGGGMPREKEPKLPTGVLQKLYEQIQQAVKDEDYETAQNLMQQYNSIAGVTGRVQLSLVPQKVKGKVSYTIVPKGAEPPRPTPQMKFINPKTGKPVELEILR